MESELEMVLRHVAEGERHVALQRRIVAHLREIGGDLALAEQLLTEFEASLDQHRAHRDRLQALVAMPVVPRT